MWSAHVSSMTNYTHLLPIVGCVAPTIAKYALVLSSAMLSGVVLGLTAFALSVTLNTMKARIIAWIVIFAAILGVVSALTWILAPSYVPPSYPQASVWKKNGLALPLANSARPVKISS